MNMRPTRWNGLLLAGGLLCLASAIGGAIAMVTQNTGLATIAALGLISGAAFLAGGWISA